MIARSVLAMTLVLGLSLPQAAEAQKKSRFSVALVPISALGSEARSRDVRALTASIGSAIARLGIFDVMPQATFGRLLANAKRADLSSCDGGLKCLADIGTLMKSNYTVFGELGGLGDAQVVYLKLVSIKANRVVRSTTLEFEGRRPSADDVDAAVVRLLLPNRYKGTIVVEADVAGASIFVDGARVSAQPGKPFSLRVGSHALRVTHPEFRDFVRFVEVEFGKTQQISAKLQQFPVVASQIRKNPEDVKRTHVGPVVREESPWYREWYTVAGIGVGALITSAVVFAILADGVDADAKRPVSIPRR